MKKRLTNAEIEARRIKKQENDEIKDLIIREIKKINKTIMIFVNSINEMQPKTVNRLDFYFYGTCQLKTTLTVGGVLNVKHILERKIIELSEIRNDLIQKKEI